MPSQPITESQFHELINETKKPSIKNDVRETRERDILFYELLYYLGLRPSEARLIKIPHINFQEKTIFIPAENNKEHQEDIVYLTEPIIEKIILYLKNRKVKSQWLFPSGIDCEKVVCYEKLAENFTRRMKKIGVLQLSYFDKRNKPRYHLNLYSFRKRFGTFVYKKTRCPQTTALMLRQRDKQYKAVWSYIFAVQQEERKQIMNEIYS